jgi:hypothetical protein
MTLISIGLSLLGAALGAAIALVALRGSARRRGVLIPAALALALAAAALMHVFVTPRVDETWTAQRARAELLAIPVYDVLAKYEPAVFERLLAQYQPVLHDRSRIDDFTRAANSEISSTATRHIAHASDPALLALMQDMFGKMRILRERSPEDCFRYLFPKVAGPPALERYFDRAAQQRTLGLMADVIRTSAEKPVAVPPPERVQNLLGPIVDAMYAEFGEGTRVLSRVDEPDVDRRMVCSVAVKLYEKVLRLPPADSAAVIRSMTQL